jgi:hypothetical protein
MDNIQNCGSYITISLSQTYIFYLTTGMDTVYILMKLVTLCQLHVIPVLSAY